MFVIVNIYWQVQFRHESSRYVKVTDNLTVPFISVSAVTCYYPAFCQLGEIVRNMSTICVIIETG